MITDAEIWAVNSDQVFTILEVPAKAPVVVDQDADGNLWIGDQSAGLISNTDGTYSSYLPNGPAVESPSKMVFNDGRLFAFTGTLPSPGDSAQPGVLGVFENGSWKTSIQPGASMTDIAFQNNKVFISSFGSGIYVTDASGNVSVLNETNSPLVNADTAISTVTALQESTDGLWVANYNGKESLHLLGHDGGWQSFSFNYPNEEHPTDLSIDRNGDIWVVLKPESGGGLIAFDPGDGQAHHKTNAIGAGSLPDINVRCITTDADGYTWVGTDAGVAYFFSATDEALKPIYENRFLLRDEAITALKVDSGNRKWIGTRRGVWLFNPTGEELIYHFDTENSPLLSNEIYDIEINPSNGEVFLATSLGIVSYRSDAVASVKSFDTIKIFPNPVHPGFNGTVGISGLTDNAIVKITDVSGKLVWETQSHGGIATWNVRTHEGKRATTGVYLVFAVSEDGSQSMVGKVAVIE